MLGNYSGVYVYPFLGRKSKTLPLVMSTGL